MDEHGPISNFKSFFELTSYVCRALDVKGGDSVSCRKFAEVRVTFQINTGFAVVKEELLPLPNHAEVVVVENNNFYGKLV